MQGIRRPSVQHAAKLAVDVDASGLETAEQSLGSKSPPGIVLDVKLKGVPSVLSLISSNNGSRAGWRLRHLPREPGHSRCLALPLPLAHLVQCAPTLGRRYRLLRNSRALWQGT